MLADLIHHVRAELSLAQLARIVHNYSTNVHDPTLNAAIQTMCSKLLLNLIDPISNNKDSAEAAKLLERMLLAFVSKMEAMAEVRDEWPKWAKPREPLAVVLANIAARDKERETLLAARPGEDVAMTLDDAKVEDAGAKAMDVDGEAKSEEALPPIIELDDIDIERARPIEKSTVVNEPSPDPVKGMCSYAILASIR